MRPYLRAAIGSSLSGLAPLLLAAQPPLDLATALDRARRAGPLAQMVEARRDIAAGRVRESAQWPNPTLEWRRENLGSPLQPDIFATLYLPVDITGRRLALRSAATAGRTRLAADAAQERHDADVQVARAWLQAGVAEGNARVAQEQADALRTIANVDAQRLREGLVSEGVGLRTALEADRARVAAVSALADAARARAHLARLLGADVATLPALAALTAPSLPAAPDSARIIAVALTQRADLRAREAAVTESERRHAAEQRGALGDVQLQGGTKETGGFMTGQMGVAVPLPLMNRNSGARERTAGELREARAQRDDARLAVRNDVTAAWMAYQAARAAFPDAAAFDTRGREVARIARVSYSEGHATLTELLDAERAAADALRAHLQWIADAWLARLDLERALAARLAADTPLDLPVITTAPPTGSRP
ncbi:MAG: TolC family protein [Gemmatimonadetes bacterium]|nr:TolC family protein [Gemmatimonadota bacterium]